MQTLTSDAIAKLLETASAINESLIVDVIKIKKSSGNFKTFVISDGKEEFKGLIEVNEPAKDVHELVKKSKKDALRIKIKQHITHSLKGKIKCIEIIDFEIVKEGQGVKHEFIAPIMMKSIKLEQEVKPSYHQAKYFTPIKRETMKAPEVIEKVYEP
jgi:hypothetical protein